MRILQLTPRFPYPKDDGGKIGMANIYETFVRLGCTVHLCSIVQNPVQSNAIVEAEKWGSISTFELNTRNTLTRGLKNIFENESTYIAKHRSKDAFEHFLAIAKEFKPDLIWADHSNMGWYASGIAKELDILSAIRLHNIEYIIWKRYTDELKYGLKKLFVKWQSDKLKNDERRILDTFDYAFPITMEDLDRALELSTAPQYMLMTAGVDNSFINYQIPPNIATERNSLVIATNYSWVHNVNGLEWFIDKVLPIVKAEIPSIKLKLVGKDVPAKLLKNNTVTEVGYVDDVREEISKYSLYIAPLLVGGGIRIKILEAMGLGLPVISTNVSAEGIAAGIEDGLYASDQPDEQAKTIIALLKDDAKLEQARIKTRDYIRHHHSWTTIVRKTLDQIFHST